jgi:hypothetical protein
VGTRRSARWEQPSLVARTNHDEQLEQTMKKLAIALSAAAVATLLSGCAYRTYDTYGYRYGYAPRYAYVAPADTYYYIAGRRYSCRYDFDSRFCL